MEIVNTLAYYDAATIVAVKGFIVEASGHFSRVNTSRLLA
jgi:hypothetical protein